MDRIGILADTPHHYKGIHNDLGRPLDNHLSGDSPMRLRQQLSGGGLMFLRRQCTGEGLDEESLISSLRRQCMGEDLDGENLKFLRRQGTDESLDGESPISLEPVYDLWSNKARKANVTNCKLVLSFRSQFFHNLRHFSNQAKERSTTQRLGITVNVCSSFRLATSTVAPRTFWTASANGCPV